MRILHVAAEAHPLIKTGGLADVASALPMAQRRLGADAVLLVPGYPAVLAELARHGPLEPVGAPFGPLFGAARVSLLRGRLPAPGSAERRQAVQDVDPALPVIVVDAPWFFERDGNPYVDETGAGWADNGPRFALLAWVGARIASGELLPDFKPDVLHAHDWHAALAPFYLDQHPRRRVRTVFTIHNLAFQGLFPLSLAARLDLPTNRLDAEGLEFHGQLSLMKAALLSADRITTVSPTYAREITTPAFGHGLDGLIRARVARLHGILNGADIDQWNPETDPALRAPYANYSVDAMAGKARCRQALLAEFGLEDDSRGGRRGAPVLAVVSRLTEQKGLDLLLRAAPSLLPRGLKLVVLGAGDPALEHGFQALAQAAPRQVALARGFDEPLSHRIFAGADAILVPSRFEPCGLTQMYGLRYGTVPIVRRVGGLADTVFDERHAEALGRDANGFSFDDASPQALADAVLRALDAYASPDHWARLQRAGMLSDVSWNEPARAYQALYQSIERD